MYCHDLEVMSLKPCQVALGGVVLLSYKSYLNQKYKIFTNMCLSMLVLSYLFFLTLNKLLAYWPYCIVNASCDYVMHGFV